MRKVMFIAVSFLMTTVASTFAQGVVKVAKDSTKTTVTTSTKVDPAKTEVQAPKDSTTKTVTTTTTVKLVKTEIKSADLPQPVKDLGTNFKAQGWDTAEVAYSVKNETGQIVYYLVTYKNTKTGETKSINIDAKGGIVNS
ncbi:MAG TPA: hypothetical protein VFC36_01235 [Paludibacter sp.]|nr:hypothetical protein [Paludibacter sp.]